MTWLSSKFLPALPDKRLDGFPLMNSWWPTGIISTAYVVIVWLWVKLASVKKSHTKPLSSSADKPKTQASKLDPLKVLMVIYNSSMVLYASFIVFEVIVVAFHSGFTLGCVTLNTGSKEMQLRFIRAGYLFYFSKFIEMLDTFFFLLRGKFDQVTFLHVFHHAAMPPSIWWGVKYAPGGSVYVFPLVNSFVHVVMYLYYGLSAAGLYRYLWWKEYLTVLQIVQFVLYLLHQSQFFTWNTSCDYPHLIPAMMCLYAAIFLVLFGNFYMKAYLKRQRLAKSVQLAEDKLMPSNGCHDISHTLGRGGPTRADKKVA